MVVVIVVVASVCVYFVCFLFSISFFWGVCVFVYGVCWGFFKLGWGGFLVFKVILFTLSYISHVVNVRLEDSWGHGTLVVCLL